MRITERKGTMARVNLYVPGSLLTRAEQLRDEGQLSQIFREALEAELRRAKWRRREQLDLEATLDLVALRRRLLEDRGNHYRAGYSIGLQHAEQTTYAAMRFYESLEWNPDAVVERLPSGVQAALEQVVQELEQRRIASLEPPADMPRMDRMRFTLHGVQPDPAFTEGLRLEIRQGCVDALRWAWERAMEGVEGDDLPGDAPGADDDVLGMLESASRASAKAVISKYGALAVFLASQPGGVITCPFAQIEATIGEPLPQTALTNRAWWANNPQGHVQASAWLGAGWQVTSVDLNARSVTFRRRE
jgi:hypothetical protein